MSNTEQQQIKSTFANTVQSIREHLSSWHKRRMALLAVLIVISAFCDVVSLGLILPIISIATDPTIIQRNQYLSWAYNYFQFDSVAQFSLVLVIVVMFFYLIKNSYALFVNWLSTKFTVDVAIHITRNQFNKYYDLTYLDFTNINSALILNHVFSNPTSYMIWIINPVIMLFSELLIVLFIIGFMIFSNPILFLCLVATVGPATFLIYYSLRNVNTQIGTGMDLAYPRAVEALNHSIFGYTDIKLTGTERVFRQKYLAAIEKYHSLNMKGAFLSLVPLRAYELVAIIGIVVVFAYIYFRNMIEANSEALTLVVLFAVSASRIMPSLNRIVSSMMYIRKTQVSIKNLNFLKDKTLDNRTEVTSDPLTFNKEIIFENINFRFTKDQGYLLRNISFTVKKGEKIGFVGVSGSGKTTLMNILLRFLKEDDGAITTDGTKLTDRNMRSWRNLLGYVKQDIFIMDASIKANIAFGEDKIDEQKLMRAITQASLQDLVDSLPEGVETKIGEKGSKLSGGQRQRIGIARALYRDAQILIFDEATSALDTATETEVTEAIDKLSDINKTIFIIAHRITTLKNCNRIYELEKGCIKSEYSYRELIDKVV
ncbi:MAG: ABC transporter ATP-binding protein [Bacteroidetes bacterium]|nr:ABC transporter ATP-binding protein [Bacteroidota bacterium]